MSNQKQTRKKRDKLDHLLIWDNLLMANGRAREIQYKKDVSDEVVYSGKVWKVVEKRPWYNERYGECFRIMMELV